MFLAFLAVSFVVIVAPGPDTAITIRNTLFGGRSGGVFTALGIAGGQAIRVIATSIGIVALLIASEPLFLAVQYAGGAYLVYLGVQAVREAIRPRVATKGRHAAEGPAERLAPFTAFRQGLISDLGNPEIAIFFASLLPQFVPPGAEAIPALMVRGLIFAAITFAWLALNAAVVARIGDALRRPFVRRSVEAVTGTLLIGLGLRIAAERR